MTDDRPAPCPLRWLTSDVTTDHRCYELGPHTVHRCRCGAELELLPETKRRQP